MGTQSACEIRLCSVPGLLMLGGERSLVADSIVESIRSVRADTKIQYCDIFGKTPLGDTAKPGKGCFTKDPQFADPKNLDYRLKPTSPCRKRASDGGDIGCRYTKEMLEMLKLAHELRKKGIIKF